MGFEIVVGLAVRYGVKAVAALLSKNGGGSAIKAEDERLIENGIHLLKDGFESWRQSRGEECWFDTKVKCRFSGAPMCGLKLDWLADGKALVDIQLNDLEGCKYRSDRQDAAVDVKSGEGGV